MACGGSFCCFSRVGPGPDPKPDPSLSLLMFLVLPPLIIHEGKSFFKVSSGPGPGIIIIIMIIMIMIIKMIINFECC